MTNQEQLIIYESQRDSYNQLAMKHAKISFSYCEDVKRFDKLIREIKKEMKDETR